jgi:hypothetical protein
LIVIITGDTVRMHDSQIEAAGAVGVPKSSISNCCRGVQAQVGGFGWQYATGEHIRENEEEDEEEEEEEG